MPLTYSCSAWFDKKGKIAVVKKSALMLHTPHTLTFFSACFSESHLVKQESMKEMIKETFNKNCEFVIYFSSSDLDFHI